MTAAELEKLLAEVTPDWRCAGKHMAIISDGNTGWDKPSAIEAYGGHLVCESVYHPAIKSLIIAAPTLARKVIAAEKLAETLRDIGEPGANLACFPQERNAAAYAAWCGMCAALAAWEAAQ